MIVVLNYVSKARFKLQLTVVGGYCKVLVFANKISGKPRSKRINKDCNSIPHDADLFQQCGIGCIQLNQIRQAYRLLNQALQLDQHNGLTHDYLGRIALHQKNYAKTIYHYQQAFKLGRNTARGYINIAAAYTARKELNTAEQIYIKALQLTPNSGQVHEQVADFYLQQQAYAKAQQHFNACLADPHTQVAGQLGLAEVAEAMGQLSLAREYLTSATRNHPMVSKTWTRLGVFESHHKQFTAAQQAFEQAYQLAPDDVLIRYNLAIECLRQALWPRGWSLYHARWEKNHYTRQNFPTPLWQGEPLDNKTLLLWSEQGIGDEIMFLSMLPSVLPTAKHVVLECLPRMIPLYQRSWPHIEAISQTTPPQPRLLESDIDYQCPLGDLGQYVRTQSTQFQGHAFLKTDPKRVAKLRRQYQQQWGETQPLVGLSWYTCNPETGQQRSLDLTTCDLLWQQPVTWVAIQYGDITKDLARLKQHHPAAALHQDQSINAFYDMEGFAHQLAALDLIVTIDNSTVHLAGALGLDTLLLLPYHCDWRWGHIGTTNHWYQSVTLLRQTEQHQWSTVLETVCTILQQWFAKS